VWWTRPFLNAIAPSLPERLNAKCFTPLKCEAEDLKNNNLFFLRDISSFLLINLLHHVFGWMCEWQKNIFTGRRPRPLVFSTCFPTSRGRKEKHRTTTWKEILNEVFRSERLAVGSRRAAGERRRRTGAVSSGPPSSSEALSGRQRSCWRGARRCLTRPAPKRLRYSNRRAGRGRDPVNLFSLRGAVSFILVR